MENIWMCSKCGKQVPVKDIFVLSHCGPKISLVPYCETCADLKLAEYQAKTLDISLGAG